MLPLTLLRASTGHPVLVELKNGDTYSGVLVSIDSWMNLNLADAVRTSAEGDAFWSVPQVYIRGNTVKYVRAPEEIVDIVAEDAAKYRGAPRGGGRGRGGYGGRGGGGGRSYAPQMLWRRQDAGRLAAACVGGVLAKDQRQVRCVDGCGRVVSWVCALALPGPIHGPSYSCGVQDGAAGSRGCRPGLCPHLPERAMIDGSTPGPVTRAEAASSVAAAALGDASPMQRRLTSSTGSACPSRQTKETRTPRERFA